MINISHTSQDESQSNSPWQPDVSRLERDFTGVVAPDKTENEKIGPESRADDIKSDEFDRKNTGKSAGWLRWNEFNDYP